ncbi:DUF4328 domain-containing protein [Streptomyces sp. NPDC026673]|uniref:DUF4328 domain-containing protein n=1 Tax=Streptomyces sp. NPDC026673 TaxID=3155724 RepID=UPI0033D7B70E
MSVPSPGTAALPPPPTPAVLSWTDPRPMGRAAQAFIAAQCLSQLGVGLVGGTRWEYYPVAVTPLVALFIGSVVTFIRWFRQCRVNAALLAPGSQKYAPGLAAGAWFIPFVMLWVPRRMAVDIARASGVRGAAWLVNAWWAAWLVRTLAPGVAGGGAGFSRVEVAAALVAGVLVVVLIQRITAAQVARAAG